MARVTVEDCLKKVKNHFELVIVASKRARQIAKGGMALVDPENESPVVGSMKQRKSPIKKVMLIGHHLQVFNKNWGNLHVHV